jgi:hypothetical protein
MSGKKAATLRQNNRRAESSDDEGTVETSSSKQAKVSAVPLTLHPLISEPDPIDATSSGQIWGAEEMVDTTG